MLLRERQNDFVAQGGSGAPSGPPTGNPDRVEQTGESLYRAAEEHIQRALSGDSLAFLHAIRQEGGQ